jgi:hypothetical protein
MSYREDLARYFTRAAEMGLTYQQADAIRRDAERLNTISERECNGDLERIEEDGRKDHNGRPMIVGAVYNVSGYDRPGPIRYYKTRDNETPARARIEAAASSVGAAVEWQGDPRGLPVYLIKDGAKLAPPCRY